MPHENPHFRASVIPMKLRISMALRRRKFLDYSLLSACVALISGIFAAHSAAALEVGDDGLHKQSWFVESFLDLRDDLKDAADNGKHFAIIWEQRGCPYCTEMHRVNLANPKISAYIEKNFHVLQLDFRGPRMVTDFDGKEMSEQALARRWGVTGTPSVNFFPNSSADIGKKPGNKVEVWRLLGYWKPYHFISNFEYVHGGHYKTQQFYKYLDEKTARLKAEGKKPDLW